MASMNRLSTEERARIVSVLVEGNSLRATARITGFARMTIEKLLRDLGKACLEAHDRLVQNVKSHRIQCDEIWAFVGSKQKNVPTDKQGEYGDIWTWTAIDADTKLIISYLVGARITPNAFKLVWDIAARVINDRPQITTDGLIWYAQAVAEALPWADFGQLTKIYAAEATGRYSPPQFVSAKRAAVQGNPNPRHISTSYVERQNLTMRMHMRRFTRLTNGFSKKAEMHTYAVAVHFMYYNFCKIHQTLRVTPAMEAGISDHVWGLSEMVGLLDRPAVAATA
jgi:IS1 family transposase